MARKPVSLGRQKGTKKNLGGAAVKGNHTSWHQVLKEAALLLLAVLVLGTLANLHPRRHIAWWGHGQQPPQAGQDFQLLDVDSAHAFWESLPNVVFVDTRSEREYLQGHVPGAVRLELPALGDMLSADLRQRLLEASAVILYGSSQETDIEQLLAQALRQSLPGLSMPYVLIGGFQAWEAAGFSLEGQP
jgi:rhodanese-related sulfurtransferase